MLNIILDASVNHISKVFLISNHVMHIYREIIAPISLRRVSI